MRAPTELFGSQLSAQLWSSPQISGEATKESRDWSIDTMGKGSNVNKKMAAQAKNQKDLGKTPEERKAAAEKAKCVKCWTRQLSIDRLMLSSTGRMLRLMSALFVDKLSW